MSSELEVKELLEKVESETERNPFMKIFIKVNDELNKEEDLIDAENIIKIIEDNSIFDSERLISGFLRTGSNKRQDIIIDKSFAPVNFI